MELKRRKFTGGFGLLMAAMFIMLCFAALNFSFKYPFLSPVLEGLNSFGSRNTTAVCCSNNGGFAEEDKDASFGFTEEGVWETTRELNGSDPGQDSNFITDVSKGQNGVEELSEIEGKNGNFGSAEELNGSDPGQDPGRDPNFTTIVKARIKGSVGKGSDFWKNSNFTLDENRGENRGEKGKIGNFGSAEELNGSDPGQDPNFTTIVKTRIKGSVGEGSDFGENSNFTLGENRGENRGGKGKIGNSISGDCDIYDGEWVKDETKPYYPPGSCPYIDRDFDCHLNKRKDDAYVKWRWQPNACDIPSFNTTDFLERLRGQTLVFVGDSLNRNMWESLVCILCQSIRNKKRVFEISGRSDFKKKGFYAFRFEDYNCSVDFVSSPFLVRESSFNGVNGSFETLRLDLMDKTTSMYKDADIIIFNTGHWWTHEKTSKGEDYYQEGDRLHPRLEVLEAYKRALRTWARWVDKHIDANRTQVIFRGYSLTHFRGGPWNSGGQCHNETEPIFNKTHLEKYPTKMKVLEHVLSDMITPVTYMNISRLTDYRKDGHPSIYRVDNHNSLHAQDCSHWCLPGVPDTWNELLYASLLKSGKRSWRNSASN